MQMHFFFGGEIYNVSSFYQQCSTNNLAFTVIWNNVQKGTGVHWETGPYRQSDKWGRSSQLGRDPIGFIVWAAHVGQARHEGDKTETVVQTQHYQEARFLFISEMS